MIDLTKQDCTGCSACINICPVGALSLKQDKNGFYKPFLDKDKCVTCGKCEKICPIDNYESCNNNNPPLFVFNNFSKDTIKSATAGGFQILAKHFLSSEGKVVGAAWDDQWRCVQILVDNEKDLEKLYKSKYVQSYMGNIYRQVKTELDNGTKILFSGLPCQIAGLYSFLNKEYENLYTVDLLCNNAPSQKHFHKFIEETYGIENITEIDFRFKDSPETSKMILKISTNDNKSTYNEVWTDGLYGEVFVKRMLVGEHCENCHFAKFPRIADITLGDIFGAERIDERFVGLKSESILINSKKGEFLFDIIKSQIDEIKEIPLEILTTMHPVLEHKWDASSLRDRMFDLLKKYPFEKACDYVLNDKYDIGLAGVATNPNYGGGLTYLALKWVLEDMGKTVLHILPPGPALSWLPKKITNFRNNPYKKYELACYPNKNTMQELNFKCEMFMVGSDQMFSTHFYNNGIFKDMDEFSSLDWAWDSKKKTAYSASFGNDTLVCPLDMKNRMRYFLRKFDNFSVRERSAIDLCKKEFGMDVQFVLDPVFLCKKERWVELANTEETNNQAICTYVLDKSKEKNEILNKISEKYSYKINNIDDYINPVNDKPLCMEDWLKAFISSSYVVTDSFHGTCFAIIFNKPFVVFANKDRGIARFRLLEEFGLTDRLIYSLEEFESKKEEIYSPINWATVNEKLDSLKEFSFNILNETIRPKEKEPSTYDILHERIILAQNDYNNKIQALKNSLQ